MSAEPRRVFFLVGLKKRSVFYNSLPEYNRHTTQYDNISGDRCRLNMGTLRRSKYLGTVGPDYLTDLVTLIVKEYGE